MKPKIHFRQPLCLIVVGLAMAGLVSQSAQADNTWTGNGTTTDWSDAGNWTGGAITNSYFGILTFSGGGTQGTTSIDDVSGVNGSQLLWTGTSAWTLNGSNSISLTGNGIVAAKIENQSTGLVTINAPITFAATSGEAWGEINAVNGDITFGAGGALIVNGSAVAGIKMFGAGRTTTFNNTVSAAGKWFATTGASATTVAIGGSFTAGDIYLMNGSTLKLNNGGNITTSGLRLGGDFGTTLTQNLALGATFQLTSLTGGQAFSSDINSVSGNTSNALLVDSQNTSGTNTLGGGIFLDSALKIQQAAGGTLALTGGGIDLKAQTLTIAGAGNTSIGDVISNSTGSGTLSKAGTGTLTLSGANSYTGPTLLTAGTLVLANPLALQNTSTLTISTGTTLDIATDGGDTAFATNFGTGTTAAILSNVKTGSVGINHTLGAASYGGGTVNIQKGTNVLSGSPSITINSVSLTAGSVQTTTFNPTTATASIGTVTIGLNNAVKTLGLDGTNSGNTVTGIISNGVGTVALTKSNTSTWTLSGSNTFTGKTLVSGGILALGNNLALQNSAIDTSGAGVITLSGFTTPTIGGLTGSVNLATVITTGFSSVTALTLNPGTGITNTYSGVIANGAMTLTKSGLGTQVFTAVNTYTGGTTINAGILAVGGLVAANSGALGTGAVTVNSTGQLRLGTGVVNTIVPTIANNITLAGGTIFAEDAFQHLSGVLNVTVAGTLGSTYNNGASSESNKGLFLDGIVRGSANLTLQQSGISTGNTYNTSIVHFNNAANTYSGTITVTPMTGTNGGSFLGLNAGSALQFATVNLNGNNSGSAFGTSPLVFNSGLGSATLGGLSGSANVVLTGYNESTHTYTGGGNIALAVGGNNSSTVYSGIMSGAGSLTKRGGGTLTLSGVNTYTGTTTVIGGTLQVGNGTTGSLTSGALTFAGGGTFNRQALNAAVATTQAMGALTFSAGDGTVQSTFGTSSTSITTTFSSLAARTAGATGNFVTSGGTNGTTNIINLTGAALGFQNQGEFFGGSNYLWVNAAGTYARAMDYGTDTGAVTSGATTSVASALHQQITGDLSGQASAAFTTLKDSGNNNIVLAGGATVTTNGILKTGNTAGGATISGGAGIQAASGAELVIRNDGLNDALTISTPIIANGSNALTASGLGTLTLSGANTYTGATTLNGGGVSGGILNLSGSILAGNVVVNGGTLNVTSTGVVNNANAASQIFVGASGGNNSILNISAGAVVKAGNTATNSIIVGNAAGSNGFIEMTGGTLATAGLFNLGNGAGAGAMSPYAAFSMSAGTVTSGSWLVVGAQNDRAVLNQSGGSITVGTNRMTIGAGGNNSIGVVNLSGNAIFNSTAGVFVGENGTGVLNVSGSAAMTLGNLQFAGNASSIAGAVNLSGGTINTASVTKGTGTGSYLFNFNGGKLQATAATGATFFASLSNTSAYVYSGGGTIDNGGFANTVAQALLAPAGSGLNSIAVSSGGTGYVDTPIVVLSGGSGVGAQAVANISGGVVTGFTITNRGSGYASTDVLAATLVGGGFTTPAVAGAIAFNTNVSGGMTFSNSGASAATTTLSGANTYSGQTTVNGNTTLKLTGSGSLANSSIVLAGGATVATQGGMTLVDGTIASSTVGGLTVGGTAGNSSILNFDAGGAGSDILSLGSGIFTVNAGGAAINVTNVGGAFTSGQTLNLLTFGSGAGSFATGSGSTVGALTLATTALSFGVTGSLNVTATQVQLVTSGAATPTAAFWTGLQGATWASNDGTSGNFYTTKAGTTAIAALPSTVTDITFTATGATNLSNTLGGDFSIKSLAYDSTTGAVVTTGANLLTIGTGGITLESGNGGATLGMTTLALGSTQIWANASANDLAVSANVTGGSGSGLTINNTSTGKTVLSGANTYSGATAVNGGILKAGSTGALSANSAYTLANAVGATLDITGFNNSVGSLAGGGGVGGNVTLGAATLAAGGNNTSTTYAGVISGTGGFTKAGTGTMILSGTNGYTGATTINAGTLTASGGSAIADASAVSLANVAAVTFNLANSETIGSLAGGGGTGGNVSLGANTLTTGGNNTTTTYSGIMSGAGSLIKTGTGSMTLVGMNTFTGNIAIDNGTITAGTGITGNLAASISSNLGDIGTAVSRSITINNGGILSLTGGNVLGTGGSTGTHSGVTLVVNEGGAFQSGSNATGAGWWNKIGALNLNGGAIHVGSGANNTNFQGLALIGTVTVGGSTASVIDNRVSSDSGYNGIHLGQNAAAGQMITFDVADVTGDSVSDLNVSAKLLNTSSTLTASGLIKTGAGTMTLSGASSYSGDTTIDGGTLVANFNNNVNNATTSALGNSQTAHNITVNNGGTLNFAQGDTFGSATTAVASTLVINAGGVVTNTAGNFTTLGPVVLNGGTLTTTGGAPNASYQSYSLSGNVSVGGSVASSISVTGGGNAYNGIHLGTNTAFTVADVTGSSASDLDVSAPLVNRNGSLGGAGGLTKAGSGTMNLSAANTYTGNTTVSAGTLALTGSGAIASSSVITVGSGATLDVSGVTGGPWNLGTAQTLGGSGSVTGAVNILGTQRPGDAGTPGTQSFSSTVNYDTGSIFEWDLSAASATDPGVVADAATGAYDKVVAAGAISGGSAIFKVVLSGNSFADAFWDTDKSWTNIFGGTGVPAALSSVFSNFSATGGLDSAGFVTGQGQFTFNGSTSTLNWSAVPEPTSALAGLLLATGLLRRRRSA